MSQPNEEQNDSPAFRLRPRQAAPKSYFAVRLDFSGSPRSFARPRTSKRKTSTSNNPNSTNSNTRYSTNNNNYNQYSTEEAANNSSSNNHKRYCQQTSSQQQQHLANQLQREQEETKRKEDKRLALRREVPKCIAINTPISPFLERLHLDDLEENQIYEHNYISLKILKIIRNYNNNHSDNYNSSIKQDTNHQHRDQICITEPILSNEQLIGNTQSNDNSVVKSNGNSNKFVSSSQIRLPLIECLCTEEHSTFASDSNEFNYLEGIDEVKPSSHTVSVLLYNDYSNSSLLKKGVKIDIAKFKTSTSIDRITNLLPTLDSRIDKKEIVDLTRDSPESETSAHTLPLLPFSIVVRLDTELSQKTNNNNNKLSNKPLIPFVTIQNPIEATDFKN